MFTRAAFTVALLMCLLVTAAFDGRQAKPRDASHDAWVLVTARLMESIKPGMTRSDLLKVYAPQGGLSTDSRATFVSRACPYFKVDVEFTVTSTVPHNPNDIVARISRPYVDTRSIID